MPGASGRVQWGGGAGRGPGPVAIGDWKPGRRLPVEMSQGCHTCLPGPCGEEDRVAGSVGKGRSDAVGTAGHNAGLPAPAPGTLQNV